MTRLFTPLERRAAWLGAPLWIALLFGCAFLRPGLTFTVVVGVLTVGGMIYDNPRTDPVKPSARALRVVLLILVVPTFPVKLLLRAREARRNG